MRHFPVDLGVTKAHAAGYRSHLPPRCNFEVACAHYLGRVLGSRRKLFRHGISRQNGSYSPFPSSLLPLCADFPWIEQVKIWSSGNWQCAATLRFEEAATSVAATMSPDGQ